MDHTHGLEPLVQALRRLPGVGIKSAQRMAFHLLQHDRPGAAELAQALQHAIAHVTHCQLCNTFTQDPVCATCGDPSRNRSQLCIVETPADQAALERTGAYQGLYFVLMGKLSPLDDVGPHDIGVQKLLARIDTHVQALLASLSGEQPASDEAGPALPQQREISEVILATNFTAEGETTAHVLTQALTGRHIRVSRLARGVPIGSELEYVDLGTIAHALVDRR